MSKKSDTEPVITKIYNNKRLKSKVDEALDEGKSYAFIIKICKKFEIDISSASLSRYKAKREHAKKAGIQLGELVEGKADQTLNSINKKEVNPLPVSGSINKIYSDLEYIDLLINQGYDSLSEGTGGPAPKDVLKAIETRAKLTDNSFKGLTLSGYRELKIKQQAFKSAITQVLLKYLDEDQRNEVLAEMDKAEQNFYHNLNVSDQDKQMVKQLNDAGIDIF